MIHKKAFTLMELMIVVAIIGILSAITVVTYGNVRARSQVSKAKADVTSIESAIKLLFQDTKHYPFHYQANCMSGTKYTVDYELPVVSDDGPYAVGSYCTIPYPRGGTQAQIEDYFNKCAENDSAKRKMSGLAGAMGLLKNDEADPYPNWAGPYIDQIPATDPWGEKYMWEGDYVCEKDKIGESDYACHSLSYPANNTAVVTAVASYGPSVSNTKPDDMTEEEWAKTKYKGYGFDNVSVLGCKRK